MMVRLLAIVLMLGAAHAAFGHDATNIEDELAWCQSNDGVSPIAWSCAHIECDFDGGAQCDIDFPLAASAPGGGISFGKGNSGVQCYQPPVEDLFGPIPTGMTVCADDINSDNIFGNTVGNRDSSQTQSGNTANNNSFGNTSGDTYEAGTLTGATHDESITFDAGNVSSSCTDDADNPTAVCNTAGGDIDLSRIVDGDQSMDSSGNSANFNTDLSTTSATGGAGGAGGSSSSSVTDNSQQTITDGDVTVTDGNVSLDSNDDNRVDVNQEGDTNLNAAQASTDGSGNSQIDLSDHSTSNVTSIYEEAYRAPNLSTQLNVTTSHCINFIGLQFSGAKSNGAGAVGLGWPARDEECRLEKAAMVAFQMENYEAGWTAYCNQKSVRHAWTDRMKSEGYERKGRKAAASIACRKSGVDTQQTLRNIHEELEMLRKELTMVDPQYDDGAIRGRIKLLENAAHLPNESFLLQHDAHHEVPHVH